MARFSYVLTRHLMLTSIFTSHLRGNSSKTWTYKSHSRKQKIYFKLKRCNSKRTRYVKLLFTTSTHLSLTTITKWTVQSKQTTPCHEEDLHHHHLPAWCGDMTNTSLALFSFPGQFQTQTVPLCTLYSTQLRQLNKAQIRHLPNWYFRTVF